MKQYFMSKPQCFIYSFAQVMEIMPDDMLATLGTGLAIWWPDSVGNNRYRGHHPQELVDYCLELGYYVLQIEVRPQLKDKRVWTPMQEADRFIKYLAKYNGVLTTDTHAVSWNKDEHICYDPRGAKLNIKDIGRINWFFPVIKI